MSTSGQPVLRLVTPGIKPRQADRRHIGYMIVESGGERIVIVDGRALDYGDMAVEEISRLVTDAVVDGPEHSYWKDTGRVEYLVISTTF